MPACYNSVYLHQQEKEQRERWHWIDNRSMKTASH